MSISRKELWRARDALEEEIKSLKEEVKKLEKELEKRKRDLFYLSFVKHEIERWLHYGWTKDDSGLSEKYEKV